MIKEAARAFYDEMSIEYPGIVVGFLNYVPMPDIPGYVRYGMGVIYRGERTAIFVRGRNDEIARGINCIEGIKDSLREWLQARADTGSNGSNGEAGRDAA